VHLFSIIQKGCGEAKEWMVAIDFFSFYTVSLKKEVGGGVLVHFFSVIPIIFSGCKEGLGITLHSSHGF